jgi:hypothetical protein
LGDAIKGPGTNFLFLLLWLTVGFCQFALGIWVIFEKMGVEGGRKGYRRANYFLKFLFLVGRITTNFRRWNDFLQIIFLFLLFLQWGLNSNYQWG